MNITNNLMSSFVAMCPAPDISGKEIATEPQPVEGNLPHAHPETTAVYGEVMPMADFVSWLSAVP